MSVPTHVKCIVVSLNKLSCKRNPWIVPCFYYFFTLESMYWGIYAGCAVGALCLIISLSLFYMRRKRRASGFWKNNDRTTVVRGPQIVTVQGVVVQPGTFMSQPPNPTVQYSNSYPALPNPIIPSAP